MSKKLIFRCQVVSPHHLSFFKEVVSRLGANNVQYVYTVPMPEERKKLGWSAEESDWIAFDDGNEDIRRALLDCDVLISSVRDIDLFEARGKAGKLTIYMSERWFKPIKVAGALVTGAIRLVSPKYFNMARRFSNLLRSDKPFYYLAMSAWAARDMARICRFSGPITFESKAGGRVKSGNRLVDKFKMWAYFVESTSGFRSKERSKNEVKKVLWVGRMVDVKRVSDIVDAVRLADHEGKKIELNLYGHGEDEVQVKKTASGMKNVHFYDPVPIAQVRNLMRENDIYVLSSNAMEGWGAVVNEAMEEGMQVIGTYEAGASSTLLPNECLYHAGDISRLASLLTQGVPQMGIGRWSCKDAADEIVRIVETKQF